MKSKFPYLLMSLGLVLGLSSFGHVCAATLDDYRQRLSRALIEIQQLQAHADEDAAQRQGFVSATLSHIRAELPPHESVLLTGQNVAVDNTWLHDELTNYEKANRGTERNVVLVSIGERLLAIIERLDELKSGSSADTKDESKAHLAEILRRPEYNKTTTAAEKSALERLWERFLRWLNGLFPKAKPWQPGTARFASGIAQIVVVAVSIALIAVLIWKFAPRYFQNRRKKKKKREARIVLGERLEPDQTSSDLLADAERLARAGDLRAAIRKAYIALLCELGDRKIISLAQHKTNRDYLRALRDQPSLFESMKRLTNSFELHWYGFAPTGERDWHEFRNGYQKIVIGDG